MNATATNRSTFVRELALFAARVATITLAASLALALVTLPMGAGLPGILTGTASRFTDLSAIGLGVILGETVLRVAGHRRAARRAATTARSTR